MLAHVKAWKELLNLLVKVTHEIGIGVRESGGVGGKAAFSDEVGEQSHLTQFETRITAETINSSWDSDFVPNHDVVQRLPAAHR